MKRLAEFFQGNGGRLSMSRLTMFLSIFPSSAALIIQALSPHGLSDLLLLAYLSPYAGAYGLNKMANRIPPKEAENALPKPDSE